MRDILSIKRGFELFFVFTLAFTGKYLYSNIKIIYSNISINQHLKDYENAIVSFSIIIFTLNILRSIQGFLRLISDKENHTSFGGIVSNVQELLLSFGLAITPFITLLLLTENKLTEGVYIFVILLIPSGYYLFYDTIAWIWIFSKNSESSHSATLNPESYRLWVQLDGLHVISYIFACTLVTSSNYFGILLLTSLITLGIIVVDLSKNKLFYFSSHLSYSRNMPPSGYSIGQSKSVTSFLLSVSDALKAEGEEKGLSPMAALRSEIENIDLITAKEADGSISLPVLNLTKSFYQQILVKDPVDYENYEKIRNMLIEKAHKEIMAVHVPAI